MKSVSLEVRPGDRVRLNENAEVWARFEDCTVVEVHRWGVACTVPTAHGIYRARWSEIDKSVRWVRLLQKFVPADWDMHKRLSTTVRFSRVGNPDRWG